MNFYFHVRMEFVMFLRNSTVVFMSQRVLTAHKLYAIWFMTYIQSSVWKTRYCKVKDVSDQADKFQRIMKEFIEEANCDHAFLQMHFKKVINISQTNQ